MLGKAMNCMRPEYTRGRLYTGTYFDSRSSVAARARHAAPPRGAWGGQRECQRAH